MAKATKQEAREALDAVKAAVAAVVAANRAHEKEPTEATEAAVREAYETLSRRTRSAHDAMPVYSDVLRRALQGRSVRYGVDRFVDIACIERAVKDAGGHFFDDDAMRFFGSRTTSHGYQGAHEVFFVTSEKRPRSDDPRLYTVRFVAADGSTGTTHDGFQAFRTLKAAERAAERWAERSRAAGRPIGDLPKDAAERAA